MSLFIVGGQESKEKGTLSWLLLFLDAIASLDSVRQKMDDMVYMTLVKVNSQVWASGIPSCPFYNYYIAKH